MALESTDVLARIDAEKETYLEELKDYIRIPSISTDPEYAAEVSRAADFLVGKLREAGLTVEKIATQGHPLVYAEWLGAPGKPTVLFYGHYDVQPADPLSEWKNPPFEPTVEGDKLYARGATDDKGQSFAHVKGVAAMLKERGSLPVNVKFLVEGEEESGGESIDRYVREDGGKRLACDCLVISDSSMYAPGQPSLVYGLKGLAYMEIKVTGPARDLHSGTYGGGVANPLNALGHIIAQLQDRETGKIQIPGFYDDVRPLEAWEREEFAQLPFDEKEYCAELGLTETWGEQGYTVRERTWARPTCDVHGLYGGYQAKGAKTVLPSWCGAKVSMRLVPDQNPEKIARLFEDYVRSIAPHGVKVEVEYLHGGQAVGVSTEGPFVEAAMAAMEDVWGKRPVRVREGGSIPIVATFSDVLRVPVLLLGFGLNDDALHSPNEKFNISHFYNGIRAIARLLDRVGEVR
ncbi:MAG TPA: dipeptidase [Thermoanaerobaculia bacterium]|nr:dipeptidase [Thermoanaerobaculia bacterium]